ncbi:hypothetical protein R1sor_027578 [Riccia sorocarpa]|uniref:DDE Tnp4 domain-containing protein n=1 Tax=Riccia sorocarpa TaxID=122646 RepID=A0ABD3GHR7_9MARC
MLAAAEEAGGSGVCWWVKERSLIWYDYYLSRGYEESRWVATLRMPKRFFRVIVEKVGPLVTKADTRFRTDVRIAATLFRLATGSNYFHTAERFGVGYATLQEFMPEVISAIIRVLGPSYLKWPQSEDMRKITRKFERTCGLPNIQGAIDCTFVPVRCPAQHADSYYKRKYIASLVLQGISDVDGAFLDISCGLLGSCNDRRVLRRSRFLEKVEAGELLREPTVTINDGFLLRPYLLGDAGYVLENWLMCPFSLNGSSSAGHRLFTERQIRGRICIERSFGILKARWRILTVGITSSLTWASKIVHCCCMLHNFLVKNRVAMHDSMSVGEHEARSGWLFLGFNSPGCILYL